MPDKSKIERVSASTDGRIIAVAIVTIYLAVLALSGPPATHHIRWRQLGVFALTPSFVDLRVFPASLSTYSAGGDPYVANPTDPGNRKYNYPRIWLAFMRFPNTDTAIAGVGVAIALAALSSLLAFWGKLTVGQGIYSGLLLCSPAVMLGVERGNTDLVILVLVILGLLVIARNTARPNLLACSTFWTLAALLKLFPVLVFAALPAGSFRNWVRHTGIPLIVFAAYTISHTKEITASLHNTGVGWMQSYGARVPILAAEQMLLQSGQRPEDHSLCVAIATGIAVSLFGGAAIWGWRRRRLSDLAVAPATVAGFRAASIIYTATFLVGLSFDYRMCFLLVGLPFLFYMARTSATSLRIVSFAALGALILSAGVNFVLAGWPGFFINEIAGILLGCFLIALLSATWSNTAPGRKPAPHILAPPLPAE